MPRHLRHFGWLYLTLIVLIGWPVFVIRSQSGPPLDVPTLHRLAAIYRDAFVLAHPQLHVEDNAAQAPIHFRLESPSFARAAGAGRLGAPATPVLKPDIERTTQRNASLFAERDGLAQRHIVYCPFPPENGAAAETTETAPGANDRILSLLGLQSLCKVRRADAAVAIQEGRWDDALRLLESSAHMGDPIRYDALIGSLIAVATRSIAYAGYTELLHAGPPPEVQEAALASLLALRESNPVPNEWVWAVERSHSISVLESQDRRPGPHDPSEPKAAVLGSYHIRFIYMYQVAGALVRLRSQIQDPALRSQADAIAARHPSLLNENQFPDVRRGDLKWTTSPVLRKWLEQVVRKEPWVYRDPLVPEKEYERLDPWTATVASAALGVLMSPNLLEMSTRGRTSRTQGTLLRAAFAANLYRQRHDAWPADFRDLAEFLPVAEDETPTTTSVASASGGALRLSAGPFLPIRFAEREVTDEIRRGLWGTILPRSALPGPQTSGGARIGPDGRIVGPVGIAASQSRDKVLQNDEIDLVVAANFGGLSGWLKQPVLMVAVAEGLNAHPRLVEWAKVEVGYRKDVPATQGEFVELRPLDAALARRITDESDRVQERAAAATHGATVQSAATPAAAVAEAAQNATTTTTAASLPAETSATQPALPPIHALRLTAKLRAPEKVMVIWSPGPDGVDDGGTISYDPSNGTMSRGDVIVYPEKF